MRQRHEWTQFLSTGGTCAMTWIVNLSETMSGWIALDGGPSDSLRLELVASAPLWSSPIAPRPFTGTVRLAATQETLPAIGTLALRPSGAVYDFSFTSAQWGALRCAGRKHYTLRGLRESLVTCPVHLYRGQDCIGTGEIKYREPIWRFALESLRLRNVSADTIANARERRG
jgi:hypothetical protein